MDTTEPLTSSAPAMNASVEDYDNGALNSDLDGEGEDSDDWYIEEQDLSAKHTDDDLLSEDADEILSSDSDGSLDGAALLNRDKRKAQRELEKRRLQAAIGKLRRDWNTTTNNWNTLTKDEMQALAQDDAALKKMRVDGWEFGKVCEMMYIQHETNVVYVV